MQKSFEELQAMRRDALALAWRTVLARAASRRQRMLGLPPQAIRTAAGERALCCRDAIHRL